MADPAAVEHNIRLFKQENQSKRLSLLRLLYDLSAGQKCIVAVSFLSEGPDSDEYDILETASYLSEEGLLTIATDHQQGMPPGPNLCLTHKGIVEVERSIDHPLEATEHFSAPVVQNFHGPVGAVQTGNQSRATTHQHLDVEGAVRRKRSTKN
jgi:hypothetical protein